MALKFKAVMGGGREEGRREGMGAGAGGREENTFPGEKLPEHHFKKKYFNAEFQRQQGEQERRKTPSLARSCRSIISRRNISMLSSSGSRGSRRGGKGGGGRRRRSGGGAAPRPPGTPGTSRRCALTSRAVAAAPRAPRRRAPGPRAPTSAASPTQRAPGGPGRAPA